jgi:hypothetical protein
MAEAAEEATAGEEAKEARAGEAEAAAEEAVIAEAEAMGKTVAEAIAATKAAIAAATADPPDGFADYDSGTYGAVAYNRATGEIRKSMHMYAKPEGDAPRDSRCIEYSTICELATYAAAGGTIAGVPEMRRVEFAWDSRVAALYFPYAGITLHHWIRKNLAVRRQSCALHILRGLAQVALALSERGIQNTDMKPANVLIHEHPSDPDMFTVSLIDYNLVSMRVGRSGGADGGSAGGGDGVWSDSFGTWCYCAPELLCDGAPHDKSPVWTLGIILASILYKYPYDGYSSLKTDDLNSQKFWKSAFKRLRGENGSNLPLPKSHRSHFTPYLYTLYSRCTSWCPSDRPSLRELLIQLTDVLGQGALMYRPVFPEEALRSRRASGDTPQVIWALLKPRRKRQLLLRTFYKAYVKNAEDMPSHVFVAAALYVDRVATELTAAASDGGAADEKEVARLAGASMHAALLYYAQYIYEYAKLPAEHSLFADKDALWKLGTALKWRLSVPVALMEAATEDPEAFYEALMQRRKPYSDEALRADIKDTAERLASLNGDADSSDASAN